MTKRAIFLIVAAALTLAAVSPFIAGMGVDPAQPATRAGLLHAWFYLLPELVDQWFWLEEPAAMLALAMIAYAGQYLALFGAVAAGAKLARVVKDFLGQPKHRRLARQ